MIEPRSSPAHLTDRIGPYVFYLLLSYLLIAPIVALAISGPESAGVLGAVGAAAILLTRLPDVSALSLFGLKATLERQVEKVEVTVDQIRKMATAFAEASLNQIAMEGQMFSSLPTSSKFETREKIVESLEELGVSDVDIAKTQDLWRQVFGRLWISAILGTAKQVASDFDGEAGYSAIKDLPKDSVTFLPTAPTLRAWGREHLPSDLILQDMLDDYERLMMTGGLSSPDRIPGNAMIG